MINLDGKKKFLLLFDLYWLRYESGNTWYELTDYLREKLREDGLMISYDDKEKDLIIGKQSMKEIVIDPKKYKENHPEYKI